MLASCGGAGALDDFSRRRDHDRARFDHNQSLAVGQRFYVLGTLLGVDLLFHGVGWVSFGMGLHARS